MSSPDEYNSASPAGGFYISTKSAYHLHFHLTIMPYV